MKKIKNNKTKGIEIALFLFPFLDLLSKNQLFWELGLLVKAIILIYAIVFLVKKKKHTKLLALNGIYLFLFIAYVVKTHLNLKIELTYWFTLFSLPTFILFFSEYENQYLNKKTITIVSFLYLILFGFSSLFGYSNDAFIYIILVTFSLSLAYLVESHSYLLKALFILLFFLASLFITCKTFYLSFIIIGIVFIILNRKQILYQFKTNYLKSLFILLILSIGLYFYLPKFQLQEIIPNKYSTVNIILNGRIDALKNTQNVYIEESGLAKLLGLGIENTVGIKIDFLTIFYSIGIIGIFFYLYYFLYALKHTKLKRNYLMLFTLFLLLSCFGNFLINPYLVFFLALLFILSKNDQGIMKKDILYVSNMYPDKKNRHYGIFVKNVYDLLKENGYTIDLVVMHKTFGTIKKLWAYIRLCGVSFLKSVFENYDYIYVHFASHSPAGVILPYLCSKDTKYIVNVHGNDVVSDTKIDEKYTFLTKLFIKNADTIIVPSNYFKKVLKKNYKIEENKVVVYPSGGIDTKLFKKMDKKTALDKLGLNSKYQYFGYVGRIDKNKGYDTYIKAIAKLKKDKDLKKNVRFLLIGSGKEEENLNQLLKKYKLGNLVICMPMVSQEELVYVYNSLEAFVYPTRMASESLGLVGLEAMACETLVIGPTKYGPSDYLISNENCLTFSATDFEELSEKIKEVFQMKATTKKKLIKKALETSQEYSAEKTKNILLKVFKKQ